MDPRIKARLQQTEQGDPLDERVRAYLMERMNAAPEATPDYSRERQLDVIGNAGTNISNIFLNRAGLGQMKAGEGFEAAARRDAVRPKETRDELASGLYESNQRAKLMAEREAGLGARTAAEDERLRAKATEDARLKEARLAQDAEALKARTAQGDKGLAIREKLANKKLAATGGGAKAAAVGFKNSATLRKEFDALPEVKQFKEVSTAFDKIQRAAKVPSAAGDLSLIFGYMKMLDPGSTVREGEFANAQNAGGVGDRIVAQYNRVKDGERLSGDQRADFLRQAEELYSAQGANYSSAAERYRGLAKKSGIPEDDVAVMMAKPGAKAAAPTAATPETGKVPMISLATGKTVMLAPESAAALEKAGKVKKP